MSVQAYTYVVTAQKPTSVSHCVSGHFTGPDIINVIVAKTTRIAIYELADSLKLLYEFPIYGRISGLELYRPVGETQDFLFVCTDRMHFFVLYYNAKTGGIETRATSEPKSKLGIPADHQFCLVDPRCRMFALHFYNSSIQVTMLGPSGKPHPDGMVLRLLESGIASMCFLHGTDKPTMLVCSVDSRGPVLKTFVVNEMQKELESANWTQRDIEPGACFVIPVAEPFCGAVYVAEQSVTYFTCRSIASSSSLSSSASSSLSSVVPAAHFSPAMFTAWTAVDNARYLLADASGTLHVLLLQHDGKHVLGISMEPLGPISVASALTYIDQGLVFVGSATADSMLIRLNTTKDETGSYIEVLETYTNLGAISDMCVVDLDHQGQGQVVTCSGAYKDGSIRVIRNGIAINEAASIHLDGIKGLWSLRESFAGAFDKYLVESFVGETRVLAMVDESLAETEIAGFNHSAPSLFCGNMQGDTLLQVTDKEVRLVACDSLSLLSLWSPGNGAAINIAHANDTQVLLASGRSLALLTVRDRALHLVSTTQLDHDIACLNINPIGLDSADGQSSLYAAVGMWQDLTVRVLRLPELTEVTRQNLGGEIIPRTLLFARLAQTPYLFVGLGDGHLISFVIDVASRSLVNRKKIALGTQPVMLSVFTTRSSSSSSSVSGGDLMDLDPSDEKMMIPAVPQAISVFAGSDRPTVIYSNAPGKLLYSNVNLKDVGHMAPFNTSNFPNCLAFASESSLVIGDIENTLQRLHIRSVPMKEHCRRIAHQPSTNTFAVATLGVQPDGSGNAIEQGFVRLLDGQTFDIIHSVELMPNEEAISIINTKLDLFADPASIALSRGGRQSSAVDSMDLDPSPSADQTPSAKRAPSLNDDDEMFVNASSSSSSSNNNRKKSSATAQSTEAQLVRRLALSEEAGDEVNTRELFVVGTAFILPEDREPTKGRLLVFRVRDNQLELVTEHQVNGAVYSLAALRGRVAAGVNAVVQVYKLAVAPNNLYPTARQLLRECEHRGHILCLTLKSRGDFVAVGDLMRSIALLVYQPGEGILEELARDLNTAWITAIEMLSDHTYLGAEHCFNLYTVSRNASAVHDEERAALEVTGRYYLGDYVNVIRPGSLVMTLPDSDDPVTPAFVFGTIGGAIGVIAHLNKNQYQFLHQLEEALEALPSLGGLSHKSFRAFTTEQRVEERSNFVDGDLIESFLELTRQQQEAVVSRMGGDVKVDDVLRRVEELARIH